MVSTNDEIVNEVPAVDVQQVTEVKSISDEDFEKAQKTFQLGKKNLFLNKYDESVNNIGDACKIYSSKFGELAPQCADIYFFYGRALLELARVENTVLGNALNGVPEDNETIDDSRYGNPEDVAADEKKEISDKVIDAMCESDEKPIETNGTNSDMNGTAETTENGAVHAETNGIEKTNGTNGTCEEKKEEKIETAAEIVTVADDSAKKEEDTEMKSEEPATTEKPEDQAEESESEEEGAEEEDITKNDEQVKDEAEADEISNLQRSWEMFELAKLVYTKHCTDEDPFFKNKRVAECLLKLGEISIEQEIYDQAINDINESIKLQEEIKEQRDERMLAESFYQLGLAQQFNNMFTDANESYQKSINIMQLRVEKLKAKMDSFKSEDPDSELERNTCKDEIADLEALLPEMIAKLEEVNEQGQQSISLIKEAKECFLNTMATETPATNGTSSSAVPNGEVKDITSLVKSKRKISNEEISTNKKTRLSDSNENGEEAANKEQMTNGISEEMAVENVDMKCEETKVAAVEEPIVVPVVEKIAEETKAEEKIEEITTISEETKVCETMTSETIETVKIDMETEIKITETIETVTETTTTTEIIQTAMEVPKTEEQIEIAPATDMETPIIEKPAELIAEEKPAETVIDTPTETVIDTPTETVIETPAETIIDTPTETVIETPAETIIDTPAETEVPNVTETPTAEITAEVTSEESPVVAAETTPIISETVAQPVEPIAASSE